MATGEQARRRRRLLAITAIPAAGVIVAAALAIRALTNAPAPDSADASTRSTDQALADAAQRIDAALREAEKLQRQGEYAVAETLLREALERHPNDRDLRVMLAETLLSQDRYREAYEQYNHAIAAGPDIPELHFAAGTVANVAGMPDRAAEHYKHAQRLARSNPKHPLYLGQIQRKLGRINEAKESLLRAANLDPSLAIAWGTLADIALGENNLSIARTHVRRAIDAAPHAVAWRIVEARILRRSNQPEQAARALMALDRATRLSDPNVLRELALCYGMLNRPGESARLYARAVEFNQKRQSASLDELLYEAALWYERAGESDVAAVYADRAARRGHEQAAKLAQRLSQTQ